LARAVTLAHGGRAAGASRLSKGEARLLRFLRTQARVYLARAIDTREARIEDYLLRDLTERNEIDYDAHAA
jgi:hypothetical protein